jgi:hypothetical protein
MSSPSVLLFYLDYTPTAWTTIRSQRGNLILAYQTQDAVSLTSESGQFEADAEASQLPRFTTTANPWIVKAVEDC